MRAAQIAAVIFTILIVAQVAFQLALALGAPLGSYAMGGAYPGTYPLSLRIGALVQGALLIAAALVVLARSGLAVRRWAGVSVWLIWLVVALCASSLVLNLITPSAGERALWAPVAARV